MTGDALARDLAERASQSLEPVYELLGQVAEEVLRSRPARAALTEAHFSGLQRLLAELLTREQGVWGMGFVAAPFVVEVASATWRGGSGTTSGWPGCG